MSNRYAGGDILVTGTELPETVAKELCKTLNTTALAWYKRMCEKEGRR